MLIKKLFLNEVEKISFTKVGAWATVAAAAILSTITGPAILIIACKVIVALGLGTTAAGARDAIKSNCSCKCPACSNYP